MSYISYVQVKKYKNEGKIMKGFMTTQESSLSKTIILSMFSIAGLLLCLILINSIS